MTNKLIRISTTGVERVRTGAASMFHKQDNEDSSLSEASTSNSSSVAETTDTTVLIDNTTPTTATTDATATSPVVIRANKPNPKKFKTHILNVEMSNVVPNDSSFEVQVENELVISELVISSQDSLDHVEEEEEEETDVSCGEEEEEESAVEVIYN